MKQENLISLPAGFTSRPVRLTDIRKLGKFQEDFDIHQTGRVLVSKEMLEMELNSPEINLETNSWIVLNDNDEIYGYAALYDDRKPLVKMFAVLSLHTQDRGLDEYLLNWVEQKAQASLEKADKDARVTLMLDAKNDFPPKANLLKSNGFQHVRTFEIMERTFDGPVEKPQLPNGLSIRKMKKDEIRHAFDISELTFKEHYGHVVKDPEEGFKNWSHWMVNHPSYDPDFWFIAEMDGKTAGICLGYPDYSSQPGYGYIDTLGVVKEFRRKGIARTLLLYAFHEFSKSGNKGAFLEVDATSLTGADRLYRSAGMEPVLSEFMYEKELQAGDDKVVRSLDS